MAMVTSSSVITAPPCVTLNEFRCSGRGSVARARDCAVLHRHQLEAEVLDEGDGDAEESGLVHQPPVTTLTPPSTASHWPVMCLPASDANSSAVPFRSSSSPSRRSGAWSASLSSPMRSSVPRGHLAREEARADGVDGDVVLAPFGSRAPGEVDDRALGRVVGQRLHLRRVAAQAGDGGDVDDAAASGADHAALGDVLATG